MSAAGRASLLAPEVVQTSAMDCGPASLKCLLDGFGIHASYGRLREACQTDVDGTSIDTLEDVARRLGLEAEQVMIPPDHVVLPEANALPAIAVVRLPNGFTHFVVAWRRLGPLVQVMDPATGRRWMPARRLERELYAHTMPVPAEAVEQWLRSDDFLRVFRARLRRIGIGRRAEPSIARALEATGWEHIAALDASARMTAALVASGGLRRGAEAARALVALHERALIEGERAVPAAYWSARPLPSPARDAGETGEADEPQAALRGAVLVRVPGRADERRPPAPEDAPAVLPPELAAALREPRARPLRELARLAAGEGLSGLGALALLLVALVVASAGGVVEVVLLRGLFTIGRELGVFQQRLGAMGALLAFLAVLVAIELPIARLSLRLGRRIESRLQMAFLRKLPRLGDRYVHSRPASDMAERSHAVHKVRKLTELANTALRAAAQLAVTAIAIAWLDPGAAPLVAAGTALVVAVPLAVQPILSERDLRLRNHAGALGRFVLDALLGSVPIRAHGAQRSVAREHEELLVEWARTAREAVRAFVASDALQTCVGFALAAALLLRYLKGAGDPAGVLLLAYWALQMPAYGQELGEVLRQVPVLRNTTLRLLEPLGALEDPSEAPSAAGHAADAPGFSPAGVAKPVAIELEGVGVLAGGHRVLEDVHLSIAAGEHVAIVGASGAGKSSLVGLLLGWHRPASGTLRADGAPLDAPRLAALRSRTAWVDPAVQLWNRSLLDNVLYGTDGDASAILGRAVEASELHTLLDRLPDGLQTPLGDSGALVSGGEGERVRLARAMMRADAGLVLLDEAFRGLERAQRRRLLARARAWWAEATLLCITHDMTDAAEFDRVVVVEDGRVVEDGAPRLLLADAASRYRALVEAEERVEREVWQGAGWRRVRLERGRLQEDAGEVSRIEDARVRRAEGGRS